MVRGARSTFLLLGVLVGLVAYIYFVDRNQPLGEADDRDSVFEGVTADDIAEVEIRSEDGETTRLTKTDGHWRIVEPVAADADSNELSTITSTLADLDIESVVEEEAADLQRFGLDPARIDVAFRTADQTEMRRVLIGDRTPTGTEIYGRTADSQRVFLISSFIDGTLNKNTFALRDKDILKFERGTVDALELTQGSTRFSFRKRDGEWDIVQPIAARGDFGIIESAVERVASAQMQRLVEPEATDLRKYGLDRPTLTVVVGTGSSRATLTLGRTEDAVVYAKDDARPMEFAVAPTIATDLVKTLEDYRRNDLFDSRAFTVTRAEFTRGTETVAFEKTTTEGNDTWTRVGGGDVDAAALDDLLGKVTGLRATGFQTGAHPSVKSPALRVTMHFGEGKTETVSFGRAGADVFASRSDEPGAAHVDAQAFDEAVKALEATNAPPASAEP
jgi:hypothetical protein